MPSLKVAGPRFRAVPVLLCLLLWLPTVRALEGRVVAVTDGDTVKVLVGTTTYKVRLADIDAPESHQPWGTRAKQALSALVYGKTVSAVTHGHDRYGRTIARLFVGSVDVNAEMVRQGHAWVYRKYSKDPVLLELERDAKAAKRGLWSLPPEQTVPPWEWRHLKKTHRLGTSIRTQ